MIDITSLSGSIAEVIVLVLGIIITRYLVPFLKEKYTATKVKNTYELVKKAVEAAEKMFPESGTGETKRQYVIDFIKEKGINITDKDLDVFIESAVKILDILRTEIEK